MAIEDKRVWTTLITNNKYLTGLLTLDHSLKKVGSKYRLVALYTKTFGNEGLEALQRRGIPALEIEYLLPVSKIDYSSDPRFYDCWSKLQPFSLYQFDKIVQLDSDMVVIKNMDELFDLDLNENGVFAAGHACVCNPLKFEHYPKDWIRENCAFTDYHDKLTHSKNSEVLGPQPSVTKLALCNGGLQVVKPDKKLYDRIVETLNRGDLNYDFADQSLLSDVFYPNWIGLSYIYNYLKTFRLIHKNLDFDNVKNIHYILTPKPWDIKNRDEFVDDTDTFQYWYTLNDERIEKETEKNIVDQFSI